MDQARTKKVDELGMVLPGIWQTGSQVAIRVFTMRTLDLIESDLQECFHPLVATG
jgi:hypothetical protein